MEQFALPLALISLGLALVAVAFALATRVA